MADKKTNFIEQIFESILWKSRLVILIAVMMSVLAAAALFVIGSLEIWHTITHVISPNTPDLADAKLLIGVIGAIDLYLIGIVLLIFAFGIYELFISKIDIARTHEGEHNILEITSLDELKNKILKVIIMVLIVFFFKTVLSTPFQTPLEILFFALAILAVATCYFFLSSGERHNK